MSAMLPCLRKTCIVLHLRQNAFFDTLTKLHGAFDPDYSLDKAVVAFNCMVD